MKSILTAIIVVFTGLGVCVSEGAVITFDFSGVDPGLSSPWAQTSEISPNSGFVMNLNSAIVSFTLQVSSTGPNNYALMSSIGGFVAGDELLSGTGIANTTSPLSYTYGASGNDNISGPIEFRLYGFGASSTAGTMSANTFSLGRTVTPVPEPAEWGLICAAGLLGVCGLHTWRQRRRALRGLPSAS